MPSAEHELESEGLNARPIALPKATSPNRATWVTALEYRKLKRILLFEEHVRHRHDGYADGNFRLPRCQQLWAALLNSRQPPAPPQPLFNYCYQYHYII